jgi:hypothetical protein
VCVCGEGGGRRERNYNYNYSDGKSGQPVTAIDRICSGDCLCVCGREEGEEL